MLVAVLRLPPLSPELYKQAAQATGLSQADIRSRLGGRLPRVLAIDPDPDRARETAAALEELGLAVAVCDPRAAPVDGDRLIARKLEFTPGQLTVEDSGGERDEIPLSSFALIQKAVRIEVTKVVSHKAERRIDLTRAVLTGGLVLTKKVQIGSTKITSAQDRFLLLHRNDGGRDVMFYERRIDYRFLGIDLQPASTANFDRTVLRMRAFAPRTPYDDRVGHPGFVSGLLATSAPPVDLALWLVQLAHLRGEA